MKRLALLRHAKSSWNEPARDDFDRPLNERGRQAARLIGAEMRRQGIKFDLVLASPARRVVETIAVVEKSYGRSLHARFDPRIYEASSDDLERMVREVAEDVRQLLLVGHNPALQKLVLALVDRNDALHKRLSEKYPTGALVMIEFPLSNWRDVTPGTGEISTYLAPRELA